MELLCWAHIYSRYHSVSILSMLNPCAQLLPWRTQSSSAGARGAVTHWEQIQQLHWSIMSSCFMRAQRAAMLERVEQRLYGRRYSCSTAAHGAVANFSHPTIIRRLRSLCSLWNFALKLTMRKLESRGYPPVKTV